MTERVQDHRPGRLDLQYWHAGFPDPLEPIRYSEALHAEAGDRLQRTIAEIASLAEKGEPEGFPRTEDRRKCRHCEYRSYCVRGVGTGGMSATRSGKKGRTGNGRKSSPTACREPRVQISI